MLTRVSFLFTFLDGLYSLSRCLGDSFAFMHLDMCTTPKFEDISLSQLDSSWQGDFPIHDDHRLRQDDFSLTKPRAM